MPLHEFQPEEELRATDVFIRSRCSCGWEGNAFPVSEQGYGEARLEFEEHELGPRRDRSRLRGPG